MFICCFNYLDGAMLLSIVKQPGPANVLEGDLEVTILEAVDKVKEYIYIT